MFPHGPKSDPNPSGTTLSKHRRHGTLPWAASVKMLECVVPTTVEKFHFEEDHSGVITEGDHGVIAEEDDTDVTAENCSSDKTEFNTGAKAETNRVKTFYRGITSEGNSGIKTEEDSGIGSEGYSGVKTEDEYDNTDGTSKRISEANYAKFYKQKHTFVDYRKNTVKDKGKLKRQDSKSQNLVHSDIIGDKKHDRIARYRNYSQENTRSRGHHRENWRSDGASSKAIGKGRRESLSISRDPSQHRKLERRMSEINVKKKHNSIRNAEWREKLRECQELEDQISSGKHQRGHGAKKLSNLFSRVGRLGAIAKWRYHMKNKQKVAPLHRFRNYTRVALICIRLCKNSFENVKSDSSEYLSIVQLTQDYVSPLTDHGGLFFDSTLYKANKEKRFPSDARRVLQKYHTFRTEKELNYAHLVLRNSIQAFAEYPNKMQEQLVKVAWYEAYEPKRAIVRQGQAPLAFYIILSGSVIVTSFDRKFETTTFLVALHRGMSFGELAVINKSRRQATVSTATITELLCISAKDFVEIFMSGGIKSILDPEQNSFIRSIPFLKYWPIECLTANPQACMFHFFGRGQVIVRDSLHSDWIYIVKSGSLSVLKKLVEVKPRNPRRSGSDPEDEEEEDDVSGMHTRSFGTWNYRVKKKKRRESVAEKEVFKNNIEMERRLEQTLPGYYNAADRLSIIDYDGIITDHKSRVLQNSKRGGNTESRGQLPKVSLGTESQVQETPDDAKTTDSMTTDEEEQTTKLPKIRKTSKGAYLASMKPSRRKATKKEALQEELFQKQVEYDKKTMEDRKFGRKTIADDLDNKMIKDFTLTEKDIRPMFVLVQVLEKGQHFGLTKSVFPEQAESFSVVSNGAECIMISKKFFLEKASEQTMLHLRQVETLLPKEEELQTGLQDFVDWRAHRAKVYNRLVRNKVDRTVRHSQYPPQHVGQYNFRSGPIVRLSSHF